MSELRLDVPLDPSSVTLARRQAREALLAWHVPQLADDVQLVVTELVANAVRHAPARVQLRLLLEGPTLRVEVSDDQPVMLPRRTARAVVAENGRGLLIVEALAQDWGVDGDPAGKTVWCELHVPAPTTGTADVLRFDLGPAQLGRQQRSSGPATGSAAS